MDCCFISVLIGGAACCLTKKAFKKTNSVSPISYDSEYPRKMTPYELEIYNAHMRIYGQNCK